MRVYLEGEEHAERAVLLDPVTETAPDWLKRWLGKHRADESRHAGMLRARIVELTGEPALASGRMDPVSRWKMRRLARLARASAPKFEKGLLVPLLAIAWRMEQMGVKVFRRHVEVLAARGDGKHAVTRAMLEKILRDERGHVAACERALRRLVTAPEWNDLTMLVFRIDRIERAFGVLGAWVLLFMGVTLWLVKPLSPTKIASSTSPSPTHAVT